VRVTVFHQHIADFDRCVFPEFTQQYLSLGFLGAQICGAIVD